MTGLSDSFQRPINYLRISVTDRCNLRCLYCLPEEGISLLPRGDILTYEEIERVVQAVAALEVRKVRLTGGEPLVRSGLASLVRRLAAIEGIDDLSLTTNGTLLEEHTLELKRAGLRRVNVSLDSLRPGRFQKITRLGQLKAVQAGLEAARRAGLTPIKINVVVLRGLNDDEVEDFARLTLEQEWHVRFIELMPFLDEVGHGNGWFVSTEEVKARLAPLGPLEPCLPTVGNGPASYYRLAGARGTIGFISAVSEHFCFHCNRLRLTADGRLRLCLLQDYEVDLRGPLRQGASLTELKAIIAKAVAAKPQGHQLKEGLAAKRPMPQIGG